MSLEGQQLGRYRILRLLGSGGMGEVYLGEDARIEQQVALKVIRAEVSPYPDKEASQEAARLFQREAKAIAKLDHPHILPLYDYGEQHLGNMTVIYLVMPYRQEGSLSDWLRERGQAGLLSPQEVAHIVGQAADALQHAHDRQIIHQDVKPSNFLLRHRRGTPTRPDQLLADFGIAKFNSATSSMSHTIRGTPTYMAPEQWEGQPVPATDQYALAIMAYELLTGHPPFQGGERQVMYQHLIVPPTPPSTVNSQLSRDMDIVLLRALAKHPQERFASITAFATAFQQAAQALHETDAPTSLSVPLTPASQGDLRAVLAISTAEAQTGTTRMLTLPGGRQVRVPIPAGVRDGQSVRLEGQGEASSAGGPPGALVLTLLVQTAEEPPALSTMSATQAEDTVLTANLETPATGMPTVSNTDQQPLVSHAPRPEMSTPASPAVSSTELAPAAKPSGGKPVSMPEVVQAEQRADVAPLEQPSQPPATVAAHRHSLVTDRSLDTCESPKRSISRRTVVLGLGLTGLVVAGGGGIAWWWILTPHPLYTYRGHKDSVYSVAWSPDGKRIASSGTWDHTVQVWDAVDGGHVYIFHGHPATDAVSTVTWSPNGTRIASASFGSDDTVKVWDAVDGGHVFTYRGHSGEVLAVTWSPDGKRIASGGSYDNTVQVWDAIDGGHPYIYHGHFGGVSTVAWSPDSTRIASAGDTTVQVWDATNGGNVFTYRGHTSFVTSAAWSPDGKRIASGSNDKTVKVWDAVDGGHVFTYRGHSGEVLAVTWSPDGKRIASGSADKTVQVWVVG